MAGNIKSFQATIPMLGLVSVVVRKDETHLYIKINNAYLSMIIKGEIKIEKAFAKKYIQEALEWIG